MPLPPGAPLFMVSKLEAAHVANKIRVPETLSEHRAFAAEVVLAAVVPVSEMVVAVENEVEVMEKVENRRCIGHGHEAHRLISLSIEMLMPGIERRREKGPLLPFERLLPGAFLPHRRRPVSADHENQLLKKMFLRI